MCAPQDIFHPPQRVRLVHHKGGVHVLDKDTGDLACANTSLRGVADWLTQHGYRWAMGSNGVWVKH